MTIGTHQNNKSCAIVKFVREKSGTVEFLDGKRRRWLTADTFQREYTAIETPAPVILPSPRVLVRPAQYLPRTVDETAMRRQLLSVRGSRRKNLSKVDRDEMAKVAAVGFCANCGSRKNLQVAHAPSGLFGKGMNIKGSGGILALLCSADLSTNTLGCHERIDQHIEPDWIVLFLKAFARTRAAIHEAERDGTEVSE